MDSPDGVFPALEGSAQLEQTGDVEADDVGGFGGENSHHLSLRHHIGFGRTIPSKAAAEAAAFGRPVHLDVFQILHPLEQFARPGLARRGAGIKVGDAVGEASAERIDLCDFEKEARELPDAGRQSLCVASGRWIIGKQAGEIAAEHACTASGRDDDVVGIGKGFQEVGANLTSVCDAAGLVGGQAAAGLRFTDFNVEAGAFEDVGHRHARLREELIHHARHK